MKLFGYNNIDHRIKAGKHVRGLEATQEPYYSYIHGAIAATLLPPFSNAENIRGLI